MTGAICDLLEHNPINKEVADALSEGHCPECESDKLVRWCPGSGFHDLCTHSHCMGCDTDFCWPIAWDPPMPITKMKGELAPQHRRKIAECAEVQRLEVPAWWKPIMESDLKPVLEKVVLHCCECRKEKEAEVIVQADHFRFPRGKWPRGWARDSIEEIGFSKERGVNVSYAKCEECCGVQ